MLASASDVCFVVSFFLFCCNSRCLAVRGGCRMDARAKDFLRAARGAGAPWEAAVQVVFSLLQSTKGSHDVSFIYAAVGECMRVCLLHRNAADALRVYEAFSRSGHAVGVKRHSCLPSCRAQQDTDSLQGLCADELALVALRQQPHRAHQSQVVAQMMAAEGGDWDYDVSDRLSSAGRCVAPFASPSHNRVWTVFHTKGTTDDIPHVPFLELTELTDAEHFRIFLQQNLQFLRGTQYLEKRLGLNYLFSQMRRVVDDKRLSSEIEIDPLVCIGRAVLDHPLLYTTPSTEAGRQQLLFEDFGGFAAVQSLSETQQARLTDLEATVDPLRPLCQEPLKFMQSLVASWDAIFARRVVHTLVLPSEAHNVLPRGRNGRHDNDDDGGGGGGGRRTRRREGRFAAGGSAPLTWADSLGELFGGANVHDAAARVDLLFNCRLHHNLVIPDTFFLLQNLNQLLQLAKHREVLIPHSVLLDVVHSALDNQGPRRFHSRRVLRCLMQATTATTSKRTTREFGASPALCSLSMKKPQGGVTLLGLQDEVFILENSPERLFLNDALAGREGDAPSVDRSSLASVLVAKYLEKRLVSPAHDSVTRDANGLASTSEVDQLVAGVIASMKGENDARDERESVASACGKPTPLFRSRSRSYWARRPVVLATTRDDTRRAAFMIGLPMFPPVSAV